MPKHVIRSSQQLTSAPVVEANQNFTSTVLCSVGGHAAPAWCWYLRSDQHTGMGIGGFEGAPAG